MATVRTRIPLASLIPIALLAACGDAEPPEAAARVENPVTEVELTTVHLSPAAETRIGLVLGAVENRTVQGRRTVGGELIAPPGSATTLTAPRAAVVLAPAGARPPVPGEFVAAGQPLLRLAALQGDPSRVREEASAAEARATNARAKAERARRLLDQGVGSAAELEDALAETRTAEAALAAAQARLALQEGRDQAADDPGLSAVSLEAPHSGIVQAVYATIGQEVADGARLLDLVQANPLWVKVPVFVGDLSAIDPEAPATVVDPGGSGEVGTRVEPVRGPRTADAAAASADLFYRMANPGAGFRPGQRVQVSVPLRGDAQGSVVPWSAVLYDINGGTWIYESLGDQAYARRRVELREVVGDVAVLGRGPAPGTPIVVVGAAELFSTEFGGTSH